MFKLPKRIPAALILLAMICLSGCEPEDLGYQVSQGPRTVTIGATSEQPATKAEIADDLSFSWTPGDQIAVWAGTETSGRYYTSVAYVSGNRFNVQLSGTRRNYAVYPAGIADGNNATSSSLKVTLPAEYDFSSVGSDYSPMPMLAVNNEGANLEFKHLGGLIRIAIGDLPAGSSYATVDLGKKINGSFPVHVASDGSYIAAGEGDGTTSAKFLLPSTGSVVLNLPVPTGEYNSIIIKIFDASDNELSSESPEFSWNCRRAYGKLLSGSGTSVYLLEINKAQLTYDQSGEAGDDQVFTVTSMRVQGANSYPAAWKTQIKTDLGEWVDLEGNCPDWLSTFPLNSTGITTLSQEYQLNVGEQPVVSHENRLKAGKVYDASGNVYDNSTKATALDLSKYNFLTKRQETLRTSANTYIVSAPGWYKIPMVYGNLYENGSVVDDACKGARWSLGHLDYFKKSTDANIWLGINYPWLQASFLDHCRIHWEKYTHWNGTEAVTEGRQWSSGSDIGVVKDVEINNSEEYMYFHVDEDMIRPGNVLLATYDDDGDCCWSWLIWITDQNMELKTVGTNRVLPVNLGWIDDTEGQFYAERTAVLKFVSTESDGLESEELTVTQPEFERVSTSGWQTYYQWGRKDPLSEGVVNVYDDDGALNKAIKHPSNIMYDKSSYFGEEYFDWTSANYNNLWDSQNLDWMSPTDELPQHKTVYDPSPRGFSVPPDAAWDLFASYGHKVLQDKGIFFYSSTAKTDSLFFPASGYINFTDAALTAASTDGYYWSIRPGDNVQKRASYSLRFRQSGDDASIVYKNFAATSPFTTEAYRAYAYSVRPVLYNVNAAPSDIIEGSQMQEIIFADHAAEWGWTTDTNLKEGVTEVVGDVSIFVKGENTFSVNDPKYIVAEGAITFNNKNRLTVSVPGKQIIQINLFFANGDGRADITATSSPNDGGGFTDGNATKDAIWRIDSYEGGVFTPVANSVSFVTSTTGSGRKIYGLSVIYK